MKFSLEIIFSWVASARGRCRDLRPGDGGPGLPLPGRPCHEGDGGGRPHALRKDLGIELHPACQQHCHRCQKNTQQVRLIICNVKYPQQLQDWYKLAFCIEKESHQLPPSKEQLIYLPNQYELSNVIKQHQLFHVQNSAFTFYKQ